MAAITAAAIVGAASLLSSYFGSEGESSATRASLDNAALRSSPEFFFGNGFLGTNQPGLLPETQKRMRQLFLASGQSQNVQGQVSNLLSRRGLTGTGLGTALQSASIALPSIMGTTFGFNAARQLQTTNVNALLGVGNVMNQSQGTNPSLGAAFGGAIAAGSGAFFAAGGGQKPPPPSGVSFASQFPAGQNFGFNLPSSSNTGVAAPGFSFGG